MAFESLQKHPSEGDDDQIPRVPPIKEPDPDVPDSDQKVGGVVTPLEDADLEDQPE